MPGRQVGGREPGEGEGATGEGIGMIEQGCGIEDIGHVALHILQIAQTQAGF